MQYQGVENENLNIRIMRLNSNQKLSYFEKYSGEMGTESLKLIKFRNLLSCKSWKRRRELQ